jgi:hypothetical protein
MTEPLDPDTLAEGDRLLDLHTSLSPEADERLDEWLFVNAPALLAVARDHARLKAKYEDGYHEWVDLAAKIKEIRIDVEED